MQPEISLLRFTTAGSVDDGKSTLIGRLMYDCKSILEDQLEQISNYSKSRGKDELDLSLLTDGLKAEREQGITIDVAYRYFTTPNRKFIIADTPGHIQYTRNMVTGASTADVAVILTDARKGVMEQTIRHTYIAALLNMKHIIFCVNKMDLIGFSSEAFVKVKNDLESLAGKLKVKSIFIVPISAKYGDNVAATSERTPWYSGHTLLHLLETLRVADDYDDPNVRFPVQYVIRENNDEFPDYRAYAGRLAGGRLKVEQEVCVLPSMIKSVIKDINVYGKPIKEAKSGDSVAIRIADDIDISRGNMIVPIENLPRISSEFSVMLCWFNENELKLNHKYLLYHTSNSVKCVIKEIKSKIDIDKITDNQNDKTVRMNDIAQITIKTAQPVFIDSYQNNPITGSLILIDESSNETVAAAMVE